MDIFTPDGGFALGAGEEGICAECKGPTAAAAHESLIAVSVLAVSDDSLRGAAGTLGRGRFGGFFPLCRCVLFFGFTRTQDIPEKFFPFFLSQVFIGIECFFQSHCIFSKEGLENSKSAAGKIGIQVKN